MAKKPEKKPGEKTIRNSKNSKTKIRVVKPDPESEKKEGNKPIKISGAGRNKTNSAAKKKSPADSQKSFKKTVLFIAEAVFALLVALFIISTGTYQDAEKQVFDLKAHFASVPDEQNQVAIVSIRDEDYAELFDSQSPLNPNQLNKVINAVLKLQPKALGIDIETSDEIFQSLKIDNNDIPIVWAQDAVRDSDGKITELKKVLGGKDLPAGNYAAPVLVLLDSDGKTRHYERIFKIAEKEFPFFAWQLFNLYSSEKSAARKDAFALRYISFAGQIEENKVSYRLNVPAKVVLDLAEKNEAKELFKDKIVILGGYYKENKAVRGADVHQTPLGEIFGTDLIANIVETEITGKGIKAAGLGERIIFNFLTGIIMLFFFHRFNFLRALLLSGIIILIISLFVILFYGNIFIFPALLFILLLLIADTAKDRFKDILVKVYDKRFKRLEKAR